MALDMLRHKSGISIKVIKRRIDRAWTFVREKYDNIVVKALIRVVMCMLCHHFAIRLNLKFTSLQSRNGGVAYLVSIVPFRLRSATAPVYYLEY